VSNEQPWLYNKVTPAPQRCITLSIVSEESSTQWQITGAGSSTHSQLYIAVSATYAPKQFDTSLLTYILQHCVLGSDMASISMLELLACITTATALPGIAVWCAPNLHEHPASKMLHDDPRVQQKALLSCQAFLCVIYVDVNGVSCGLCRIWRL
jgi:hypothetical protein